MKLTTLEDLQPFWLRMLAILMFSEQQLLTKISTIFVNCVLTVATNERLVEVHNKHIEGQNFAMIFEVFKINLFLF